MPPAGSSGWRRQSARNAKVLSRSDPTSSSVHRRGSDHSWTRCRVWELPRAAIGETVPVLAVRGLRGTSSVKPLERLVVTDPRCNGQHPRFLEASPETTPSRRAAATPPRFPRTGRRAGTKPFPAAAACAVQVDVGRRARRACERDSDTLQPRTRPRRLPNLLLLARAWCSGAPCQGRGRYRAAHCRLGQY